VTSAFPPLSRVKVFYGKILETTYLGFSCVEFRVSYFGFFTSHYELGSALKLVQKPKRGVPRGCLFFGRNFWLEINKRASQRVFTFGEKTNVLRNEFLRLVSFRTGLETKITL